MEQRILRMRHNRRGNAMLEFAIGAGVLLSVLFGTFQFGFTFLRYNTLVNAARRGARYAAIIPYNSATNVPATAFTTAVKNVAVYGNPGGTGSPILPDLTTSHVNLSVTFSNGAPSTMTVSINGYSINSYFRSYTMSGKPRVSFNYQGIWAPI